MKLTLKKTSEQLELIKAMASRDKDVAYQAQLALANFVGPALAEGLDNAKVLSNLFLSLEFDADDNPSIPLDIYYDITDLDYINIWHQTRAGGLGYNQVVPTDNELKLNTYSIESALAFDKRHASRSRVDVIAKTFERLSQELLMEQEKSSANIMLGALANASTNGTKHVQRASTAGEFILHDFNQLVTLADIIDVSWIGGTPANEVGSVTDLMISPKIAEKLRAMAYNPISTDGAHTGSENFRDGVFANTGAMSFYGINLLKFKEFGQGKRFNTIFDAAAGATVYTDAEGANGAAFDGATEEILVGLDRNRKGLVRSVAVDSETGSTLELFPDDQFVGRQKKIGFVGGREEARLVLDDRALFGVIV